MLARIFQSTFPRGERLWQNEVVGGALFYFNPRSRVGNDISIDYDYNKNSGFQSTFPRGERLICMI